MSEQDEFASASTLESNEDLPSIAHTEQALVRFLLASSTRADQDLLYQQLGTLNVQMLWPLRQLYYDLKSGNQNLPSWVGPIKVGDYEATAKEFEDFLRTQAAPLVRALVPSARKKAEPLVVAVEAPSLTLH